MEGKKVNPRFMDLIKRQRTEGFLEAEARKVEEARRLTEEEKLKHKQEFKQKRKKNLEGLKFDEESKKTYTQYLDELNKYEGDELETAMYAFFNHPDFSVIYNQLETIAKSGDKWGFLLRRAYEIGEDIQVFIGSIFQNNSIPIKRKLEEYGIHLLCPYFVDGVRELYAKDNCVIDGRPAMSFCEGKYDICNIFKDRAEKAAVGQFVLPNVERSKQRVNVPKLSVEPVDLQDLEDWWRMEGKYE